VVEECITAARAAAAAGRDPWRAGDSAGQDASRLHPAGMSGQRQAAPVRIVRRIWCQRRWSWRGRTRRAPMQDSIEFRAGSLLNRYDRRGGEFDILVSNPPYVADAEWAELRRMCATTSAHALAGASKA